MYLIWRRLVWPVIGPVNYQTCLCNIKCNLIAVISQEIEMYKNTYRHGNWHQWGNFKCHKWLLKPLEVILSVEKGRHAVRLMLGWTPWATRRKTWWYSCHHSAVTITGPQQGAQQKSCNGNSRLMPKIITTFVSMVWCIPHHRAYHPRKKARSGLFFDCRGHIHHCINSCNAHRKRMFMYGGDGCFCVMDGTERLCGVHSSSRSMWCFTCTPTMLHCILTKNPGCLGILFLQLAEWNFLIHWRPASLRPVSLVRLSVIKLLVLKIVTFSCFM